MSPEELNAQVKERFDAEFRAWTDLNLAQPAEGVEALRIICWMFYKHGANNMQRIMSADVMKLAKDLQKAGIDNL